MHYVLSCIPVAILINLEPSCEEAPCTTSCLLSTCPWPGGDVITCCYFLSQSSSVVPSPLRVSFLWGWGSAAPTFPRILLPHGRQRCQRKWRDASSQRKCQPIALSPGITVGNSGSGQLFDGIRYSRQALCPHNAFRHCCVFSHQTVVPTNQVSPLSHQPPPPPPPAAPKPMNYMGLKCIPIFKKKQPTWASITDLARPGSASRLC